MQQEACAEFRATIIEEFEEVRELSVEVENHLNSIHEMFHNGIELLDENVAILEKRQANELLRV